MKLLLPDRNNQPAKHAVIYGSQKRHREIRDKRHRRQTLVCRLRHVVVVTGNFENSEQLGKESGLFLRRHKLRPSVRGIDHTDDYLNRGRAQNKFNPVSLFDARVDESRRRDCRGDGDPLPVFPALSQKSRTLLIVGIYDGDQPSDPFRTGRCSQTARRCNPITTASRRDLAYHRQLLPFEILVVRLTCLDVIKTP